MKPPVLVTLPLLFCGLACGGDAPRTYSLSGAVTGPGGAVAGVTVAVVGANDATATTDSSGSYRLTGLSAGTYSVNPTLEGYRFTPAARPVTITDADIEGTDFAAAAAPAPAAIEVPKTGQVVAILTGDDGDLQKGAAWPSPRFTDNADGTVIDALTGLVWLRDAACLDTAGGVARTTPGKLPWADALLWANALASGECSLTDGSVAGDWRLPNVAELESLVDVRNVNPALSTAHPFLNVQPSYYGTSTTTAWSGSDAWLVYFDAGYVLFADKQTTVNVWPVRGPTGVARLPATGQRLSYAPGDDGWFQAGAAWPSPRFVDPGDGTVKDQLTGLIWLRDADCADLDQAPSQPAVPRAWPAALAFASGLATGHCGLTDGSSPGDWRLPNRKEFESLIDRSARDPALPAGHPFQNVQWLGYWTSTAAGPVTSQGNLPVWVVRLYPGTVEVEAAMVNPAVETLYAWALRGP